MIVGKIFFTAKHEEREGLRKSFTDGFDGGMTRFFALDDNVLECGGLPPPCGG
jgi:hypothetical protein